MTKTSKALWIGLTIAIYIGAVGFMMIYSDKDRVYTAANPAVPMVLEVDWFDSLTLSDQATVTLTSAMPFRIETKDGPVDSTFLDASHFQIGPIDVEGKVKMVYGDGRMSIVLVHARSLTVTGTGVQDDFTSATLFLLVFGYIFVMIIAMGITHASPPK